MPRPAALLTSLAALVALSACSPAAEPFTGAYRVKADVVSGPLEITATGHVAFGAACELDVTVTVTSTLARPTGSSTPSKPAPVTVDPSGTYRYTKTQDGPTVVSRDGGSPIDVLDPDAPSTSLTQVLLPLTLSTYPLPGHGGFLCAFSALPDVSSRAPSGELTWDTQAARALSLDAARAWHASVADLAGLDEPRTAEYLKWASALVPPLEPQVFEPFVASLDVTAKATTYRQRLRSETARFDAEVVFEPVSWSATKLPVVEPYASRRAGELAP